MSVAWRSCQGWELGAKRVRVWERTQMYTSARPVSTIIEKAFCERMIDDVVTIANVTASMKIQRKLFTAHLSTWQRHGSRVEGCRPARFGCRRAEMDRVRRQRFTPSWRCFAASSRSTNAGRLEG